MKGAGSIGHSRQRRLEKGIQWGLMNEEEMGHDMSWCSYKSSQITIVQTTNLRTLYNCKQNYRMVEGARLDKLVSA